MPDPAAFLAAIVANPADDLPRLVYADWLDDSGDPDRAEFIRVQCELDRLPPGDDGRPPLEKREKALLRKHAARWTGELTAAGVFASRELLGQREPVWRFRRGFLHAVTMLANRFPAVAETLFRVAPLVRAVRMLQGTREVRGLLGAPLLAKVTDLDLSHMCTCGTCPILAELRTLFASGLVGNLTALRVAGNRIDAQTATALVSSPHLRGLETLDLSGNALGLGGVRVLAAAGGFSRLRELNLSENGISASGGQVLARAAWLGGLRVLDLSRNRLSDTSGRAVMNAEFGPDLVRVELRNNDLSAEMKRAVKAKLGAKVRV